MCVWAYSGGGLSVLFSVQFLSVHECGSVCLFGAGVERCRITEKKESVGDRTGDEELSFWGFHLEQTSDAAPGRSRSTERWMTSAHFRDQRTPIRPRSALSRAWKHQYLSWLSLNFAFPFFLSSGHLSRHGMFSHKSSPPVSALISHSVCPPCWLCLIFPPLWLTGAPWFITTPPPSPLLFRVFSAFLSFSHLLYATVCSANWVFTWTDVHMDEPTVIQGTFSPGAVFLDINMTSPHIFQELFAWNDTSVVSHG